MKRNIKQNVKIVHSQKNSRIAVLLHVTSRGNHHMQRSKSLNSSLTQHVDQQHME